MGTSAWKFCWIAISLLVEVPSLFCQVENDNDLQLTSGCDCTYIEQPVSDLSCDPYLSGVTAKCAVVGLQSCSIEWYRTGTHGGKEILIGDITTLETLVVQVPPYRLWRRNSTLAIDESSLVSGQQYRCQVRVDGELIQQSSTLLIESMTYYTSRGYTLCQGPQSATVARCADVRPAAKRTLAILLPIWLCVLACLLLLIIIVIVDRKRKKNRNATVTRNHVTPVYELICNTNLSSTKQGVSGASNYAPSDTERDIDNMLYSDACTTRPAAVPTTDEDCTVYQRLDPESTNYISMYSKPSSVRPPGKESEYQLIDSSKLDPENPYAIRNPPVKRMEVEEGTYQLIDSSKLDPENPYSMKTPPTKGSKAVYQLLDSFKLDLENPYAIRNPLAKDTGDGV